MQATSGIRRRVNFAPSVKVSTEEFQRKGRRRFGMRYWLRVLRNTGSVLLAIYLVVPVWFCLCPWFRRQCVFLNNFNWPPFETSNLSLPDHWGIHGAKHFFVDSEPGVRLGVWHIQPKSKMRDSSGSFDQDFDGDRPVILYLHGNSMNRAATYRRALYRVLTDSDVNAHVVTFDYRGFGDSTNLSPSVAGLVADGEAMYSWLQQHVTRSRILLWGHSLGSGVTVQLAAKLNEESNPAGIILESPFTSIADAVHSFPLSMFHRFMPFFDVLFCKPTRHLDTNFNSDEKVHLITAPMLMLHAADDDMVSVELGRKLHKKAQNGFPGRSLQFVEFNSTLGYGHLNIHRSPDLPKIVLQFIESIQRSTPK